MAEARREQFSTDVSSRIAIEQELKARRRQQETIAALSKKALGGAPFEDLARRTTGRAREALNVELAGVFMQKAANAGFKAWALAAGASLGIEMGALSFAPTASLAASAVVAGVPIISADLRGETRFTPHPELLRVGFASAIAVAFGPLKGNWGLLAAYSRTPGRFTGDDAHFIEAIANILTSTIANAEADQKLQRSEAYFRSLIEHTSDVITVIDRRGIIRFMGGAFEAMFGYAPEQTLGKPSIGLLAPEGRAQVAEATKYAFRHPGEVTKVEYRQPRADSSWVDCEAFMKTVTDLGDETLLVVSMRDVSDRKRHEEAVAHARDAALESVQLKTAFLTNMSHEVRTPINIIMGYSELVTEYLRDQGDESQIPFLEAMTRAGRRLLRTINGIIDYSKLSSGSLEVAPGTIKLGPLLERHLNQMQAEAAAKNLTITCDDEHAGAEVWFDEYCLSHALLNLLDNAIKFTQHGGVKVRLYRGSGGAVCLDVSDTGIGIDAAFLPHLLEPFSQEDASFTRKFEGSGLGLAVARSYLECNGARLTATSNKGVGSVFTITFPRAVDCGVEKNGQPLAKDADTA